MCFDSSVWTTEQVKTLIQCSSVNANGSSMWWHVYFCLGSLVSEHNAFSHFVLNKNLLCALLVKRSIASESLLLRGLSLLFCPTWFMEKCLGCYTLSWFYNFSTNSAFSSVAEQEMSIMEKSKVTSAGMGARGLVGFLVGCGLSSLQHNQDCVVCFPLKWQVNLD